MKYQLCFFLIMFSITKICQRESTIDKVLQKFENAPTKDLFKVYHLIFSKQYNLNSQEGIAKYRVFKQNLKLVQEVNSKNLSYRFGINQFFDLTDEEFTEVYLPTQEMIHQQSLSFLGLEDYYEGDIPFYAAKDPIDYRNFYNPARDLGKCKAFHAFSLTGTIEGHIGTRDNKAAEYLSTKDMIDCSPYSSGCYNGIYEFAYQYAEKTGFAKESDYPYKESEDKCTITANTEKIKIVASKNCSNFSTIKERNCSQQIIYDFLKRGPVSTTIDGQTIKNYKSGIFNGEYKDKDTMLS